MLKQSFKSVAYDRLDDLVYAHAKHPVNLKNGMSIGGGVLYPEINFTLPTMLVNKDTMPEAVRIYKEIAEGFCERARDLSVPGFVAEIETVPAMTFNPEWAIEVCKTVVDVIKENEAKHGIPGAVRITPNDNREGKELTHMWHGKLWDQTMQAFEGCAKAGAELLSIESIGGKESHDDAVMYCNLPQSLFALSILGCRDMEKMWTAVVDIANSTGAIPAGDTACGFANTAMVLAESNYIPRVFGAAVRVMASVRSLVAIECGAKGPDKDCGYEGVYHKVIAGIPISMEGRVAACAHLSRVGNIALCMADLWSNESVQQIKLLGGYATAVSFEQLAYDCRQMNEATKRGPATALCMRDILADSDSYYDPHAYILRPDVVYSIAKEIVKEDTHYHRMKTAGIQSLIKMREGVKAGKLKVAEKELGWLDDLQKQMEALPQDEEKFIASIIDDCDKLDPKKYDM